MKNKPSITAVAFDMDGLIFNTEDLYDQVGEILLSQRGGTLPVYRFRFRQREERSGRLYI